MSMNAIEKAGSIMDFLRTLLGGGAASAQLKVVEASARLKEKGDPVVIIDVRQPEEFSGGHIHSARLMPLNTLSVKMHELPKDRDILVVCRSGSRSSMATRQLVSAGYRAINLSGGMMAWEAARLPVKRGK
jgi:rhodanese-related sulfurtransferase